MKNNNLILVTLLSALSILVAVNSLHSVYAQENMTDLEEPKFFAIQHAQSGSISEINSTAYSLELNDVSDKTILFSDRPDRIVTSVSTADFVGNWSVGENNYAIDVPNTVLVVDEQEGKQDVVIVELFNPVYDVDKNVLKYDITPDNATSIELPIEIEQSTLVIDGLRVYKDSFSAY
ncbi:MAG: hypothetical protein ACPKPY_05275 [Nitrososphaeraceae archaeon]